MTPDPIKTNPYHSPLASCKPIESTNTSVCHTFRWRVIPVILLYIFGICLIFSGLLTLGTGFWRIAQDKKPLIELWVSLALVPGWLFLYAGWNLWKGRWRRGSIATLLAILAYVVAAVIANNFGW